MTSTDLLALRLTPGGGYVSINRLIAWSISANIALENLIGDNKIKLSKTLPADAGQWVNLLAACNDELRQRAARLLATIDMTGMISINILDERYPDQLKTGLGLAAPPLLFLCGGIHLLKRPMAGVVGTRKPTAQGAQSAIACAKAYARNGIPIVSGGAAGVDSIAHGAALDVGGHTVIVLPQGILSYTLPVAYKQALLQKRVLLVSEFHPMSEWQTHAAITRNSSIAAFSRVLCVIEAHKQGGSVRTARTALKLQRPVFYQPCKGGNPDFAEAPLAQSIKDQHRGALEQQLEAGWHAAPPTMAQQLPLC